MFIIQNLINECDYLQITPIEYGYLKLITTLESGKSCVFFSSRKYPDYFYL